MDDPGTPADAALLLQSDTKTTHRLFQLLRETSGIEFGAYSLSTIERRVARRMTYYRMETLADYVRLLDSSPSELQALHRDLLIRVTSFFRDGEPFASLRSNVFPTIAAQPQSMGMLRIWVPGCSTGEEVYSIAIELHEFLEALGSSLQARIFATDVDEWALARARKGIYDSSVEQEVSPERLSRFFVRSADGYQISPAIRDRVIFARHDLTEDPPYSRLDLISCRNVLIYLQPPAQRMVLSVFHFALCPERFLLLGATESVGDTADFFLLHDRKNRIYVRKGAPTLPLDVARSERRRERLKAPASHAPRSWLSVTTIADRKVLERYAPPGIVIDEGLEVLQYRGMLDRFLRPTTATSVLDQVRPELATPLASALEQARATGQPTTSSIVRLGETGVVMDVVPLVHTDNRPTLIVFHASTLPRAPSEQVPGTDDARREQLERELAATRLFLQTTIEQLQSANEELESLSEDLQSTNEELQTSNEQLRQSRDELEDANEELVTLNASLYGRMAGLEASNEDLNGVLDAIDVAVVLVGSDLTIRRFSARAARDFHLTAAAVGGAVGMLRTSLAARDLEWTVADVLANGGHREQRVSLSSGASGTLRVQAYGTSGCLGRGAMIEFIESAAVRDLPTREHSLGGTSCSKGWME